MANRNTQKVNTFTFIGAEYKTPSNLNENIRAWFRRNSPHEPQLDMIPNNVRFSAVKNVLTATTYDELPDWYAALDSVPRDLIYYCVAVTAHLQNIPTKTGKNKKNTVFPEKMCVFTCKFLEKYVPLQCQKEKEVTTIKTGGNCNSAPRL